MRNTRIRRRHQIKHWLLEGPYNGEMVWLDPEIEGTITFTAKGETGCYEKTGKRTCTWGEK